MSRLIYILSRHRTQSRTFAYMIKSWYACSPLIWFGKTSEIFWIQTICKLWKQVVEREKERLALAYESLVISKNIMYRCWKWYLWRCFSCALAFAIRKNWCFACFLSHVQMFKLTKLSFLNSIRIWSGSELWQRFFKGERIQISLKVGHHRPASETPVNGVSLACRWRPTLNAGLVVLRISGGPVQYCHENLYFCDFSEGGGGLDPLSPSGSAHRTGQCIHLLRYT